MELWRIAIRALVAYLYLLFMARLSGKRVVREATTFDFVIALIVGDMIDDSLWGDVSMARFAGGVGSLFVCDALVKFASFHSERFFHLVQGPSRILVRDGVEDAGELRKEQMNKADVAHLRRLEGIEDWRDVRVAVLEREHELSVILRPGAEPVPKKLAAPVIEMMR